MFWSTQPRTVDLRLPHVTDVRLYVTQQLSIGTFTAMLHLRHVERSEVQDTAAAHAYVMADLRCHLLDLFMNIRWRKSQMLWDLDRSSHERNYFPNCTYGTGNFERCGCLSSHFTWLGEMRIPSVVAAWIRHVRACAPAGHVTVDIGLLKKCKVSGRF